jgi:uncharacterized peroxidase-related enzyme
MNFELHSIDSAPDEVKPELETVQQAYAGIPNLYRGMANNPATLKIYLAMNETLARYGSLSPVEQQVVYLSVSAHNECTYCVAAHSVLADMATMPGQIVDELRAGHALSDARLNALRQFTLAVIASKGWVTASDIADFQSAGYEQKHVLEVLTILAQKTLSNYYNHIAQTPLDDMFKTREWRK